MATERILSRFLGAFLLLATSVPLMAEDSDRWVFRVYLDDREIGFHEFSVTDRDGGQDVEISAEFDVKFLFFNAYSYDHRNLESWAGQDRHAVQDHYHPAKSPTDIQVVVAGGPGKHSAFIPSFGNTAASSSIIRKP